MPQGNARLSAALRHSIPLLVYIGQLLSKWWGTSAAIASHRPEQAALGLIEHLR